MQELASNSPAVITVTSTDTNEIEWRPVLGWEGYYEVSNTGLVRSLAPKWSRIGGKVFKPHYDKDGYNTVTLRKKEADGTIICKTLKVHRLVAFAFIANPENKPFIDHINGMKADNRVDNLRWCTQSENENNPITKEIQRAGQRAYFKTSEGHAAIMRAVRASNIKQAKAVRCIETGEEWESAHEAARQLGFNQANISKMCKNIAAGKPIKMFIYRGKPVLHFCWV